MTFACGSKPQCNVYKNKGFSPIFDKKIEFVLILMK